MDDKTRERYAAIGRGERLQWRQADDASWNDWVDWRTNPRLNDDLYQWRIAPPAPIPVELPRDVFVDDKFNSGAGFYVRVWFKRDEQAAAFVDTVRKEQSK